MSVVDRAGGLEVVTAPNVAVVVNVKVARDLLAGLREALDPLDVGAVWHLVSSPSGASRASRHAIRKGATVIVVAGGTRSIAAVLEEVADTEVAVAAISTSHCRLGAGTVSADPRLVVENIVNGYRQRVPMSVGSLRRSPHMWSPRRRPMVVMCEEFAS